MMNFIMRRTTAFPTCLATRSGGLLKRAPQTILFQKQSVVPVVPFSRMRYFAYTAPNLASLESVTAKPRGDLMEPKAQFDRQQEDAACCQHCGIEDIRSKGDGRFSHSARYGLGFVMKNEPGCLRKALDVFDRMHLDLTRLASHVIPLSPEDQVFKAHFEVHRESEEGEHERLQETLDELDKISTNVWFLVPPKVPWFPYCWHDIDSLSKITLDACTDLEADHPGFHDKVYRSRREEIAGIANSYQGTLEISSDGNTSPIAPVEYTETETEVWRQAYTTLRALFPSYACKEYNEIIHVLENEGLFSTEAVPQLQDVSELLRSQTGFSLRPVTGLLGARDFLNALAFKIFFSTQYIRHHSTPLYTPEPDIIHELIGHVPMLANQEFAEFSQMLGLASLGATDDQITKLASCYWFSVEFGLLREGGKLKAYGAGLLSSFGELKHSTDENNKEVLRLDWDPYVAAVTEYPITTYQPKLFVADSLNDAKARLMQFCESSVMYRDFAVTIDKTRMRIETDSVVERSIKA